MIEDAINRLADSFRTETEAAYGDLQLVETFTGVRAIVRAPVVQDVT